MAKKLDFNQFAKVIQQFKLDDKEYVTNAHHSNGSGRDWEAVQKMLADKSKQSK